MHHPPPPHTSICLVAHAAKKEKKSEEGARCFCCTVVVAGNTTTVAYFRFICSLPQGKTTGGTPGGFSTYEEMCISFVSYCACVGGELTGRSPPPRPAAMISVLWRRCLVLRPRWLLSNNRRTHRDASLLRYTSSSIPPQIRGRRSTAACPSSIDLLTFPW